MSRFRPVLAGLTLGLLSPAAGGGAGSASAPAALPPLIPRDVLFGNPERVAPQIAPDGKRLAYLAPQNGVMNLWVRTVGTSDDKPVTREETRPIRSYQWAKNGRQLLYAQDKAGDENFHVYRVDLDKPDAEAVDLTPFPNIQASVVATEPEHPNQVLIQHNGRDPRLMDVYRCDLQTGKSERVAENPGTYVGWAADADLHVRAAVARRPDGTNEVYVRGDAAQPAWRLLLTAPFGEQAAPLGFTRDGKSLYLLSNKDVNTLRLYRRPVAADSGASELLHARDDVDIENVLVHPTRHTVQAVSYNKGRREWVALDPDVKADLQTLKTVQDGDFAIASRDTADTTWLIAYRRDNGSPAYYVYDRKTKKAEKLFTAQPKLDAYTLARTRPIEIPARDGLTLPSYLTLPVGTPDKPAKPGPLVLAVHGGPWARDTWGYSPFVQWLANRGYAVLQVNFRGSTGFGKAFHNAGNREWAGKMHDDLVDAVGWAVENGYADKTRVAIMGGSYGGYATLVGLTVTPDLFACGVDIVGPSNIQTLFASIPPYWAPMKSEFLLRVGDPEKEPDLNKRISPLFMADRIQKPLLIAQGANDPRVKQAESDQIVRAMRKNAQEVTYLVFADEGHGFARPENNLKFCAAAEKFLADHLGGRFEPAHPGEEPPLA